MEEKESSTTRVAPLTDDFPEFPFEFEPSISSLKSGSRAQSSRFSEFQLESAKRILSLKHERETNSRKESGLFHNRVLPVEDNRASTQSSKFSIELLQETKSEPMASPSPEGKHNKVAPIPLPHVVDFQPGTIPTDKLRVPAPSPPSHEESYIPVALARQHISKIVSDMQQMKADHVEIIQQITSEYGEIEQKTRQHYEEFVAEIKARAVERLRHHKRQYSLLLQQSKQAASDASDKIQSLECKYSHLVHENKVTIEKIYHEKGQLVAEHEKDDKWKTEMHHEQLERLRKTHAEAIERYKRINKTLEGACMTREDMIAQLEKNVNHLNRMEQKMIERDQERAIKDVLMMLISKLEFADHKSKSFQLEAMERQLQQARRKLEESQASELRYKRLMEEANMHVMIETQNRTETQELATGSSDLEKQKLQYRELSAERARIRGDIKQWMSDFEQEHGRVATSGDKEPIRELYLRYRRADEDLKSIKDNVKCIQSADEHTIFNVPAEENASIAVNAVKKPEETDALDGTNSTLQVPEATINSTMDSVRNPQERSLLNSNNGAGNSPEPEIIIDSTAQVSAELDENEQSRLLSKLKATIAMIQHEKRDLEQQVQNLREKIMSLQIHVDTEGDEEIQEDKTVNAEDIVETTRMVIQSGREKWAAGDKAGCYDLYANHIKELLRADRMNGQLIQAKKEAEEATPSRGAVILRKSFDKHLETLHKTKDNPPQSRETRPPQENSSGSNSKMLLEYKQKLKTLENKAKGDKVKIAQLEASLSKAENASKSSALGRDGDEISKRVHERKITELEKRNKAEIEQIEKQSRKELNKLSKQLDKAISDTEQYQDEISTLSLQVEKFKMQLGDVGALQEEAEQLRLRAAEADEAQISLKEMKKGYKELEDNFKQEQSLRKKYYNMIEDMKGKIRVFARCRPLSSSELERGNSSVIKFIDEYTMELQTSKGIRPFSYDQIFSPANTQDQVFEDTKNLMQSAMDGFNVCIFAYGQTGSGKTFTMSGTNSMPGLTPRAIKHLFDLAYEIKANNTVKFSAYMLEVYNDSLIDLFYLLDHSKKDTAPKLEIKKNNKGMVVINNITIKSCDTPERALKLFDGANKHRQVGATKMNAESSRSHSIFAILIENYDRTTKKTSVGKLSLVDLAGSERVGKTGATADRLKEAQAINKSLSALGDVISALSTGEKFIPYRNNKLTQLMQDSLGGNAKTLMFVNISPADYNVDETQTSLSYASRVKLITNSANKNAESEEISKLKAIIRQLRTGDTSVDVDTVL